MESLNQNKVRYATLEDYEAVLSINDNVYEGADYVPGMYRNFILDPNSRAYVLEINGTVVAFFVCTVINGGRTCLPLAGRIRRKYEDQGIYRNFVDATLNDIHYHFPEIRDIIGMSKVHLGQITDLVNYTNSSKRELLQIACKVTLQATGDDITFIKCENTGNSLPIKLVKKSELEETMMKNKPILEPFLELAYQPYQVTDDNIKYIVNNIAPLCFIISKQHPDKAQPTVTGMSFQTRLMCKAGLVIYTCFRVADIRDFELHFRAQLDYVLENVVSTKQEKFHVYVLFPISLRFGKVLQVAYSLGLRPGIRDEGFLAIFRQTRTFSPAKL